jgi:hypothetical protein
MTTEPHTATDASYQALPVRETILKHWAHHKVDGGQTAETLTVSTPEQVALVDKAIGEHYPVLRSSLRAIREEAGILPQPVISGYAKRILGDEDSFLRERVGMRILSARFGGSAVVLEAPKDLTTREEVGKFAESLFPVGFKVTRQPVQGAYRVILSSYDLQYALDVMKKPVGYRALLGKSMIEREAMEEEFRAMMGQDEKPKEREMEALVQEKGMAEALRELTADYRVMFEQNIKNGVYVFPVVKENMTLPKIAKALIASGKLPAEEAQLTKDAIGMEYLHLTPRALESLRHEAYVGVKAADGSVAVSPITSHEADRLREAHFTEARLAELRRDLAKAQLKSMSEAERAEVQQLLNGKDIVSLLLNTDGVPVDTGKSAQPSMVLEVASRAIESVTAKREAQPATLFDVTAMRGAIARAQLLLAEDKFWRSLSNAQLVSQHNGIREESRAALSDLDTLLKSQQFSQAGLTWLANQSPYAPMLRDMGHLLAVVQDENIKGYNNGAQEFQNAFHLPRAALKPTTSEARSASYNLRRDVGKVGWGGWLGNNLFMGIRPILSSVQLAIDKPVLVGGAVLGIAGYSAAVPKEYSIPRMLNKMMHDIMEKMGVGHSHDSKAGEFLKKQAKDTFAQIKAVADENPTFGRGFAMGQKFGRGQAAGVAAGLFVAFNLVEDVIVHLPLALVSVGVGAAGGVTGRKVLAPVFSDVGDFAGYVTPEPVRKAWRADVKLASEAWNGSWLGRFGNGVSTVVSDASDFGVIATAQNAVSKVGGNLGYAFQRVVGSAPPPQQHAGR